MLATQCNVTAMPSVRVQLQGRAADLGRSLKSDKLRVVGAVQGSFKVQPTVHALCKNHRSVLVTQVKLSAQQSI